MCENSICFILISESEVMRFLGCGIVCGVFLTFNLIIEITPNPKICLCTQKWNETLPRHEFCGKELGKGCEPNVIYNCTRYGAPAMFGYLCSEREGYDVPSCSPVTSFTCNGTRNLLRCQSQKLCTTVRIARMQMIKTYGENWEKTLLS
jgi:hypothetical protein